MKCRSNSTRATALIVRLSMSCRSAWRIKIYVNFSLFQSMPDAWGIDQLFPVMPLEGLNKSPERRAVLLDITCDSDGAIDH
ncbi:arginine decarboxylase [Klebsiella quasipneumoniae]|nr:arginine decarboxylase [Klebsiella quasipneumoniae]